MSVATEIPIVEEESAPRSRDDEAWAALLGRLGRLSVSRHFDAYGDIDWDSEELRLDPEDPRWELSGDGPSLEPIGATDWYKSQPPSVRARLGCEMAASKMKLGLDFESILKRGLLEFACAFR